MNDKILYLECYSGISGDMTVAALLDLGANEEVLRKALLSLSLEGYRIEISRVKKNGIDACDFNVILDSENTKQQGQEPHGQVSQAHKHDHRHLSDIYELLEKLDCKDEVKNKIRSMFDALAQAEAKAHGIPAEMIHFHEVGAVDSIVDMVAAAVCLDNLGIKEIIVSPLYEGSGHVHCQHGMIPVPVPAVINLVQKYGLVLKLTDNIGEMVTPTGAVIAAVLKTRDKLPEAYQVHAVGLGAGKKDFVRANLLRAMLIEEK